MNMKLILTFHFLLITFLFLAAQEKPCLEYERPKYSTGPHPKTSPIFPGCESFKENNDSLNYCFRNQIGNLIAHKLDREFSPNAKLDSTISSLFRTKLFISIDTSGKLKMNLTNRVNTEFENRLVEKINEISEETVGITPAKFEGNFCARYSYTLPLIFDLKD